MTIGDLQRRVLEYTRQCIAARLVSVRELARRTHWSQPYLQLVIAGDRPMRPEIADALIRALQITALDLYTVAEMQAIIERGLAAQRAKLAIADQDPRAQ